MTKEEKEFFFIRETGFRKMTRKKRFLDILQGVLDILLGYAVFLPLMSEKSFIPFLTLLIAVVKLVLHCIRHDSAGNYLGLGFAALFTVCVAIWRLSTPGLVMTIAAVFIVHALRIKSCMIDDRIKNIYGYPNFNGFIMDAELEKDELLRDSARSEYSSLDFDKLVSFAAAEIRCSLPVQIMKVAGLVLVSAGIILCAKGAAESSDFGSSVITDSLEGKKAGDVISGTVHEIYSNTGYASSSSIDDEYWGVFGGKYILFSVPYGYKNSFATLYNCYANENDLAPSLGTGGGPAANPKTGIRFSAVLKPAKKYEGKLRAPDVRGGAVVPEAETDFFFQVVDPDRAASRSGWGGIIIGVGAVMTIIAVFIILRRRDDTTTYPTW